MCWYFGYILDIFGSFGYLMVHLGIFWIFLDLLGMCCYFWESFGPFWIFGYVVVFLGIITIMTNVCPGSFGFLGCYGYH